MRKISLALCLLTAPMFAQTLSLVQAGFSGDASGCNGALTCTISTTVGVTKLTGAFGANHIIVLTINGEGTSNFPVPGTPSCSSACGTWVHVSGGNVVSASGSSITNGNYCAVQDLNSTGHHFFSDCWVVLSSSSGATGITETFTDAGGGGDITNMDLFVQEYSCSASCNAAIDTQKALVYPGNGATAGCTSCTGPAMAFQNANSFATPNELVIQNFVFEENCVNSGSTCPATGYTVSSAMYDSNAQNGVAYALDAATAPAAVWGQTPKGGGISMGFTISISPPVFAVLPTGACTNNGNGSGWGCAASSGAAGAFIGLPAALVRGDVYCLGDGNYGNRLSLTQADSGSTVIELRKAQSYDPNCSGLPNWNTSTMGSAQAYWQSTGSGQIVSGTTDNWLINGNGNNAGTLEVGCGGVQASPPSSMTGVAPTPSACGIKIDDSTCTSTATDGCDGGSGVMKTTGANYVWVSGEWFGQGLNSNGNNNSETYFWFASGGNLTTTSMSHMYMHNASTTYFTIVSGGENGGTFDHNYVWGVHDGSVNHGEAIQLQGSNSNFSVFKNIFRDQQTNGDMVGVNTGTQTNFSFYDNVDFCSAGGTSTTCRHNDGFLGCFQSGNNCVATTWVVYNNTLSYPGNCGVEIQSGSGITFNNNLFYNCSSANLGGGATITQDYNSYLNGGSAVGAHDVASGSAPNPFVNLAVGNANLASDNSLWNNRNALGSPYNVDLYGNAFTTDRGAAQFVSGAASFNASPTTIPANHANNIAITLAGTGTSWSGSTAFSISGVAGATLVSKSNTSATAETLQITTGSSTGVLTVTDTTDSISTTITVATATLTISPTAGNISTTPSLTITGVNTLWTTETAAGLFTTTGSGCSGESIGTPTVTADTAATATLTTGAAPCTITITDTSTTATASFTVSSTPTAPTVTTGTAGSLTASSAIISGNSYVCLGGSGCSVVTSEGTCYATTANPTTPCTSDGTLAPWSSSLSGLSAAVTYHFRAFATNAIGTAYGSDVTFTTLATGIVPLTGTGCTKLITLTGASPTATTTCAAATTGNAVIFHTECHPNSGSITGITLTAPGWTINQSVPPNSTGSNSWMAEWTAVAPNTTAANFLLGFTGASDCANYGVWNIREVTGNNTSGGSATFNATGASSGAASTCNQAGAAIVPPLANEFVDVFCVLGSATTATSPWTLGQTDGNGNSEEYQVLVGGAGTTQTPAYNGSSGAYIVEGVAIAPAGSVVSPSTASTFFAKSNFDAHGQAVTK